MIENATPNRRYQLPHRDNELAGDVARLVAALSAIDVDVAAMLAALGQRALALHQHAIADTTGLQAVLDSRRAVAEKGGANGYAGLDATGKVPASQLPAALFGSLSWQGTWNANANTPAIPVAAAANKGQYYKVGADGATSIGGVNDWKVGDWIVSNGASWDKIDNTDQVASVAGLQGAITAAALKTALAMAIADVTGLPAALNAKVDTAAWNEWSRLRPSQAEQDARYVRLAADGALGAGYSVSAVNDGPRSGGATYAPLPAGANMRCVQNAGAFTFAADPDGSGKAYSMVVLIQNAATAGPITFSGFTRVNGAARLTTASGASFWAFILKVNATRTITIEPLQ